MNKRIIITGASSGIGKALAQAYAAKGFDIGIMARRATELALLCDELKARYPAQQFLFECVDVSDLPSVAPSIQKLSERLGGLDIFVANAGTIGVRRTGSGDLGVDLAIFNVNLLGAIACIDAATAIFRKQKHGHLVGISSFSAFVGIPGSAAYSASKAALTNYLQAVRTELSGKNIQVSCIHPGFINTDLSTNMEKYPFVIPADKAAHSMVKAIARNCNNATVPAWPWALLRYVLPLLPDSVLKKIF
jgi:short-subunit dehydrogenase